MNHSYWSRIEFFHEGDEYFNSLSQHFKMAKNEIQIESYIFEYDQLTIPILKELAQARQRGVQVQLMVDGAGSLQSSDKLQTFCLKNDIAFRVYQPLYSFYIFSRFFNANATQFFRFLRRLNRRNHRKLILIDGHLAFLGSLNFTEVSSQKYHGKRAWKESGVLLGGPCVNDFLRSHQLLWNRARKNLIPRFLKGSLRDRSYKAGKSWANINTSFRARFWIYRNLLKKIRTAKKDVLIETAYFLPKRSLLRALAGAANRGVNVQIIVPGLSDVPMVKWASYGIMHTLAQAGVRIYEYTPSILHAKFTVIDDWATLGSSNMNYRSLHHDLEIEAIFSDSPSIDILKNRFQIDLSQSTSFQDDKLLNQSYFKQALYWIAFKLRYLL